MRAQLKAGRAPGPESSVGKVHQGRLNQALQLVAFELLGAAGLAWTTAEDSDDTTLPLAVRGMLRSRANTIGGGMNENILGERVLGLPREPDPWACPGTKCHGVDKVFHRSPNERKHRC